MLRFDVIQDRADPAHVVLVEVYRDEEASAAHKQTAHYATWRNAVAEMMPRSRANRPGCAAVFPADSEAGQRLAVTAGSSSSPRPGACMVGLGRVAELPAVLAGLGSRVLVCTGADPARHAGLLARPRAAHLRVLRYLKSACNRDDAQREDWSRHWIREGFEALERQLRESADTGSYCHGDTPSLADCCLIPQMANAQRVQLPLDDYPVMRRIYDNCMRLPAFAAAAPGAQPDAE